MPHTTQIELSKLHKSYLFQVQYYIHVIRTPLQSRHSNVHGRPMISVNCQFRSTLYVTEVPARIPGPTMKGRDHQKHKSTQTYPTIRVRNFSVESAAFRGLDPERLNRDSKALKDEESECPQTQSAEHHVFAPDVDET